MIDTKENEERGRMIAHTLATVVDDIVRESGYETVPYQQPSKFEAFRAPGISIRDYLMRIHKYASCSPECFVLALVYIDRLQRMQGFVLTHLNVHRVVITSVVLAAKFFDDHYFNNAYYAKVGGVLCKEMNELEIEYLLLINFSLHVGTDTYARFYNELVGHYNRTNVRNPYMSPSPYYDVEHFVTEDSENEGQLVYVTNYNQRVPDTRHHGYHRSHHHSHSHQQHPSYQQQQHQSYQQHQQVYQQEQQQQQYQPQQPYYHQQQQQQQQQHYRRRTIEEPTDKSYSAPVKATSSPKTKATVCTTATSTTRASGQKRRSAVALGVNA